MVWKTGAPPPPQNKVFYVNGDKKINIGQLIDLQNEEFPILRHVLFMIRKLKLSNMFCFLVSLIDKRGLLPFRSWVSYLWCHRPRMTIFHSDGAEQWRRFLKKKGKEWILLLFFLLRSYGSLEIVVFNGLQPTVNLALQFISIEFTMWSAAGARELMELSLACLEL
jgi:hypothetical protein